MAVWIKGKFSRRQLDFSSKDISLLGSMKALRKWRRKVFAGAFPKKKIMALMSYFSLNLTDSIINIKRLAP